MVKRDTLKNNKGEDFVEIYSTKTSFDADIFIIKPVSELGAEELAMLQALYSRSYASILTHLQEVSEKGCNNFMQQYYVQYGHKSIGDCGSILMAAEGVSMLCVKAIQDSQLYNGQEASTRYINFSNQPFMALGDDGKWYKSTDVGTKTAVMQESLRDFYLNALPRIQQHLFDTIPYESIDQSATTYTKAVYERTIKARSFDIVRGFLPAGATTTASWYSSISHAADHIGWLRNHPLMEVREVAEALHNVLLEAYPSSFGGRNVYTEREVYKREYMTKGYYLECGFTEPVVSFMINNSMLYEYRDLLINRPKGQDLPMQIGECGVVLWEDNIDFGSFRDIQRHRAIVQRQGLLTVKRGFHDWYLNNLPDDLRVDAVEFISQYIEKYNELEMAGIDKFTMQYFTPMGFKVPIRLVGSLSKLVYLVELRSQKTVHPTLHDRAHWFSAILKEKIANALACEQSEIPFYIDDEVGMMSMKRGTQTILKEGQEL